MLQVKYHRLKRRCLKLHTYRVQERELIDRYLKIFGTKIMEERCRARRKLFTNKRAGFSNWCDTLAAELLAEMSGTTRNRIHRTHLFICSRLALNVAFALFVLSTISQRPARCMYFSVGRCAHQLRQYFDRPGSNGSRGEIYAGLINSRAFIIYALHTRRTINFERRCAHETPVTITRPHWRNSLNRPRAHSLGRCSSTRRTSNPTIERRTVHTKKCERATW